MNPLNNRYPIFHIGCSGFQYKHWKPQFYPEKLAQTKWFNFYADHFNTLELNVTFYRFPNQTMVDSWYRKSPDEFVFAVKAPRAITHYKKFNDSSSLLKSFYSTISSGLKEKLGCVLFQLPPSIHYSETHLEKILHSLSPDFKNVLEFRHESWWNKNVYDQLKKNNISFCGMSHPELPDKMIKTAAHLYYRLHGNVQLYGSLYTNKELRTLIKEAIDLNPKEIFFYFNNDINVSAIQNALYLKNYLKDKM